MIPTLEFTFLNMILILNINIATVDYLPYKNVVE